MYTKFGSRFRLLEFPLLQNLLNHIVITSPRSQGKGSSRRIIRIKLIFDLRFAGPVHDTLRPVLIGDKDIKRIHDIDKRHRRILAVSRHCLKGFDNHHKVICVAFIIDFDLL